MATTVLMGQQNDFNPMVGSRKPVDPNLDLGVNFLANQRFQSPPNSPTMGSRSLNLDFTDEERESDRYFKPISEKSRSRQRSHERDYTRSRDDTRSRNDTRSYRRERDDTRSRDDRHSHRREDTRSSHRRDDRNTHRRDDTRSRDERRNDHGSRSDDKSHISLDHKKMPKLNMSDLELSGDEHMDAVLKEVLIEEERKKSRDKEQKRDRDHDRSRDRDHDRSRDRDRSRERRSRERSHHPTEELHGLMDSDIHLHGESEMDNQSIHQHATEDDEDADKPLSPKELMKKKRKLLLRIKILESQGFSPYKDVSILSPLEEITEVADEQLERRSLSNNVQLGKKFLVGSAFAIEKLNDKYNPFDFYLDGWSNQVFAEKDEYDEVIEELYYKYSDQVAMAPEVKLLGMLGTSALMFHFSKSVIESGKKDIPQIDEILASDPELKQRFQRAAVNVANRNQSSPNQQQQGGGGNFFSNILGSFMGNQEMGNNLNNFMASGGQVPPNQMMNDPNQQRPHMPGPVPNRRMAPPSQAGRRTRVSRPGMNVPGNNPTSPIGRGASTPSHQEEVEIIPPEDVDHLLDVSSMSESGTARRRTRGARDNLTSLVV